MKEKMKKLISITFAIMLAFGCAFGMKMPVDAHESEAQRTNHIETSETSPVRATLDVDGSTIKVHTHDETNGYGQETIFVFSYSDDSFAERYDSPRNGADSYIDIDASGYADGNYELVFTNDLRSLIFMFKKTRVRSILELLDKELSARDIAKSLSVSRNTVSEVQALFSASGKSWEEYVAKCKEDNVSSCCYVTFVNNYKKYNVGIRHALMEFNEKPFQKRQGSRMSVFMNEEKPYLRELPMIPYEVCEWSYIQTALYLSIITEQKLPDIPLFQSMKETVYGQRKSIFQCPFARISHR